LQIRRIRIALRRKNEHQERHMEARSSDNGHSPMQYRNRPDRLSAEVRPGSSEIKRKPQHFPSCHLREISSTLMIILWYSDYIVS
jgi:hypothetical protein